MLGLRHERSKQYLMKKPLLKESRFNVKIPSAGGVLVFNTLSKSLVKLDQDSKLGKTKELENLGFFVEDGTDENQIVNYWLHKRQFSKELAFEILGTNNCNLRCEYCFAYYRRNKGLMSESTLAETISWISSQVSETNPKRLKIVFSGGEPTLNVKAIETIANFIKKNHPLVKFNFGMITNGTTLNESLIKKLRRIGLTWVQITLDGPKAIHDRRRPLANSKISSFDLIYNNLNKLGHLTPKIYLRVNIDFENSPHIEELLLKLKELPVNVKKRMYFQFARVIETKRKNSLQKNQRRVKEYNQESANWEVECYRQAKEMGFNLSINLDNIFDPHGPCMFVSRNSFIITTQGDIHKCVGLIKEKDLSVGNVKTGLNRNVAYYSEKGTQFLRSAKCGKCHFLPVCYGGCHNIAYLERGDMWAETCPREYFETCSLELVKVLYE